MITNVSFLTKRVEAFEILKKISILKMSESFIDHEFKIREHPNQQSPLQIRDGSKLHGCTLNWSDKCAPCELCFDELRQKMLSLTDSSVDSLNYLKTKIEEPLAKLEGFVFHLIIVLFWLFENN